MKLEADIEEPGKSPLFKNYPGFLKNHHALNFVCDTLRMYISGGVGSFELDQMMELDMEVHHQSASTTVASLSTMADALPGLGIVAAVLGVVITMGALGGPPEEIGHKVAAALVGTFLGILLCYGFFGPMASNMAKLNDAEAQFYHFLRVAVNAFIRGCPRLSAVPHPSSPLNLLGAPSLPICVPPSRPQHRRRLRRRTSAPGLTQRLYVRQCWLWSGAWYCTFTCGVSSRWWF